MVRAVFITVILIMALSIGFPVSTALGGWSYLFLRQFGLDVSMTPMTVDMAMMLDQNDRPLYETTIDLIVETKEGQQYIPSQNLNLYHHKMPMNLYFEIIANGGTFPEGRVYICRGLENLMKKRITSFMLQVKDESLDGVYNDPQYCF